MERSARTTATAFVAVPVLTPPRLCVCEPQISTNAFAISTLRCSEPAAGYVQSLTHTRLGVGLYCEAAMFNHSCVPNALVKFSGREMSVVATRHIEKGAPVTVSYGPLASKVNPSDACASLGRAYARVTGPLESQCREPKVLGAGWGALSSRFFCAGAFLITLSTQNVCFSVWF